VPEGLRLRTDLVQVRLEKAGGGTFSRSNPASNSNQASVREDGDVFWLKVSMPRSVFERVKNQPVRIRTSLLLTLFGKRTNIVLPPGVKAIPVPQVGLCDTALPNAYLYRCRAPFRGPRLRLETQGGRGLSYTPTSPFPAELGVSPMWTFANFRDDSWPPPQVSGSVSLTMEQPLTHLRRVLMIDNLRMADYGE
jgi:hypothetical protein